MTVPEGFKYADCGISLGAVIPYRKSGPEQVPEGEIGGGRVYSNRVLGQVTSLRS